MATSPISVIYTNGEYNKRSATGITVLINFGNGTIHTYSDIVADTVYNATEQVTSVEADWYGDNVFVTSIAGVANDPEQDLWWQYWVNDELGPVAANKYILTDGDVIEWKLPPNGETTTQTSTIIEDPSLALGISITALLGIAFLIGLYIMRSVKR